MVTHILGASAPADDFSRRQVLPLSASIRPVRFARRDWEISSQVREILDGFEGPPIARPATPTTESELSIVMEGNEIRQTMRTGSHVVSQRYTSAFGAAPVDAPLAIVEPFEAFGDDSLRADAAAALAAINDRKPHGRRGVRLTRQAAPKPPKATRPAVIVAVLVLAVATICALLYVAKALL